MGLRFRDLSPKPYMALRFYCIGNAQTFSPKPLNPVGFNGSRKPKVSACIPSAPFRVKTFVPCRALSGFRVLTLNESGLRSKCPNFKPLRLNLYGFRFKV